MFQNQQFHFQFYRQKVHIYYITFIEIDQQAFSMRYTFTNKKFIFFHSRVPIGVITTGRLGTRKTVQPGRPTRRYWGCLSYNPRVRGFKTLPMTWKSAPKTTTTTHSPTARRWISSSVHSTTGFTCLVLPSTRLSLRRATFTTALP